MEFLKLLESIRTPFLDSIFSVITTLGEETLFILIGLIFFWCINKKQGYYLLSVGLIGTVINQFLKLIFRIPRPWVKDPNFTIIESAREAATGYSFPSGHTQSSVGVFGGIARFTKHNIVRIICIIIAVLVPFSRMYLGVHTPLDILVSIAIALILIFGIYPVIQKGFESKKTMRILFALMTLVSVAFLIFVSFYPFPADTDLHNLTSGIENGYKMLGCILGIWLSYEIDQKYIDFKTDGVWYVQLLKLVLGLIPVLLIKSVLKQPLHLLFNGSYFADFVRYFLLTAFAGCVWPLTFNLFNKISKK